MDSKAARKREQALVAICYDFFVAVTCSNLLHGNKDNSVGRRIGKATPAVEQDSDMVVPVQEHELLFVNDDKESIDQFPGETKRCENS